jgi:TetR/AcrR family tetracycline transcriptional repressor
VARFGVSFGSYGGCEACVSSRGLTAFSSPRLGVYGPSRFRVKGRATKRATGKSRKREPGLSEQDILAAALHLIRARGVEALSMRGLAKELGVSPMAIYYHVRNKDELLDRVAERVLAEVPTPEPSPDAWERQMRDYALAVLERLSACPGLSGVVVRRAPVQASQRLTLYVLSVLRAGGFDERAAAFALMGLHTYLLGALTIHTFLQSPRRRRRSSKARARPSVSPELRPLLEQLGRSDPRQWLDTGVETMLAGIRAGHAARPRLGALELRATGLGSVSKLAKNL